MLTGPTRANLLFTGFLHSGRERQLLSFRLMPRDSTWARGPWMVRGCV